jgi:hypothetical protein
VVRRAPSGVSAPVAGSTANPPAAPVGVRAAAPPAKSSTSLTA